MSDTEDFYRFPTGELTAKRLHQIVAVRAGVTPGVAAAALRALKDVLIAEMRNGYSVRYPGLGKFSPYVRSFFDKEGEYKTHARIQFKPVSELYLSVNDFVDSSMTIEELEACGRADRRRKPHRMLQDEDYAQRDKARRVTLKPSS